MVSGLLFWGAVSVSQSNSFPIKNVRVDGLFKHVSQEQLKNKISQHISGGFFSADVFKIESKVEEISWVKSASVRRIWPDALGITIEEQRAVAIWNESSLLNAQGEIFDALAKGMSDDLPHLRGPDGSHAIVLSQYKEMLEEIRKVGKRISVLQMDERHAWRIELNDGIELRVGRNNIHASLRRFTQVIESAFSSNIFSKNINDIVHVDLRYTNGFAVKWKPKRVSLLQNELLGNPVSVNTVSLNAVSSNTVSSNIVSSNIVSINTAPVNTVSLNPEFLDNVDSLRRNN